MSLKRTDAIITSEYLSLEHDRFQVTTCSPLETCLCCFIHGHYTNYQCNCTYLKAITVVRIAMLLAPAVHMVFKEEAINDHFHFGHFLLDSCDVSAHTVLSILFLNGMRHHSI